MYIYIYIYHKNLFLTRKKNQPHVALKFGLSGKGEVILDNKAPKSSFPPFLSEELEPDC